ncbi:amidase [Salisediminibacterium halotolerans]|uniref:Amidase n=1 Tax=Salisediminibacterium halotolerans TaxID=517425 RepID=A0A1H9T919_9BACI|nr:amidase [Salisediminibacterium haloalkalitolerans]SER93123.1 amidase [Salisediminibacterium haloalkalitolerans]
MDKFDKAFVHPDWSAVPTGFGCLSGKSFAIKDVFYLSGRTNTAGNPDWYNTHLPAESTAPVIQRLLDEGALLQGLTVTDELMYSLQGENAHYGTPPHPTDPTRTPGGSSSGSASAAARGLRAFTIGTDTGGSVRIPAAYCGLYGMRPTHGSLPMDGVIPLAPSFDTVGWMSASQETFIDVGRALFNSTQPAQGPFHSIKLAEDAFSLCESDVKTALSEWLSTHIPGSPQRVTIAGEGLAYWAEIFRIIQGKEIWEEHGGWVTRTEPNFGPGIRERFETAAKINTEESASAANERQRFRANMLALLGENNLLVLPTVPGCAPKIGLTGSAADNQRKKTMQLSCIAGLAGLPQVTLPVPLEGNLFAGLSVIAPPGRDLDLLEWLAANLDK